MSNIKGKCCLSSQGQKTESKCSGTPRPDSSTAQHEKGRSGKERPTFPGTVISKTQGGARLGIFFPFPEPKRSGLIPASVSGAAFWSQASCLLGGVGTGFVFLGELSPVFPLQSSPHHLQKEFLTVWPHVLWAGNFLEVSF